MSIRMRRTRGRDPPARARRPAASRVRQARVAPFTVRIGDEFVSVPYCIYNESSYDHGV